MISSWLLVKLGTTSLLEAKRETTRPSKDKILYRGTQKTEELILMSRLSVKKTILILVENRSRPLWLLTRINTGQAPKTKTKCSISKGPEIMTRIENLEIYKYRMIDHIIVFYIWILVLSMKNYKKIRKISEGAFGTVFEY